jgi:hypothetical protein
MNAEIFAEWVRRQGHRVFRTASSYWYEAGPRVLQAFPYHWLISPSEKETRDLMTANGIISLRYSTFLNSSIGKISYHLILHDPYGLTTLKAQALNSVKRGLRRFDVKKIPFEKLAKEGWILQQDTLARQNRLRSMTQAEWELICRSAADLPGFEAWAALSDGELAAAVIVCQIDSTWCVPYFVSHRKFLNDHSNNALLYSLSCNLLARDSVEGIFFTVQSLDALSAVDDFTLQMGLIPKPVRQRVDFHPLLTTFATPTTHRLFTSFLHRNNENLLIAKAEGMLRFHIEGKQPFTCQHWPECLISSKEDRLKDPEG